MGGRLVQWLAQLLHGRMVMGWFGPFYVGPPPPPISPSNPVSQETTLITENGPPHSQMAISR